MIVYLLRCDRTKPFRITSSIKVVYFAARSAAAHFILTRGRSETMNSNTFKHVVTLSSPVISGYSSSYGITDFQRWRVPLQRVYTPTGTRV